MNQPSILWSRLLVTWGLALGTLAFSMSIFAHELEQTVSDPGFRPESAYAAGFLDAVGNTKIAVLPTLVRRVDRTAHSFASQVQIVAFLNESGIATAVTKPRRIDLGRMRHASQWDIFQYTEESIGVKLEGYETGADYTLVMELLIPGDQAVFGIEVYIMDRQGQSAFSFLLNSHHQVFSDAKLFANKSSENARNKMVEDATRIGLKALSAQIELALNSRVAAADSALDSSS